MPQNLNAELFIDGYISHTFKSKDAEEYQVSLLKRDLGQIQWHTDTTRAYFLVTPPAGSSTDQDDGIIVDYVFKDTGPVIWQKIWVPKKPSDKVRRVDHEQLNPPIFFIHKNGQDLGLPLIKAAGGDCSSLRGAEEAALVGSSAHAQIRVNWWGYQHLDWNEQISIQKQTSGKENISLETFAKHVGRKVLKFMEYAKDNANLDNDQRFIIGDNRITPGDIILIGTVQVSQGSWMPILQLNNWIKCL